MARESENGLTPETCPDSTPVGHSIAWFGWMALFGTLGVLVAIGVHSYVDEWCDRDTVRQCRQWMTDQADQLRRGEIDCLVNPEPAFVEELLTDATCAANVRELYLGGDLSDPRLAALRELPNLRSIVFLFAENHEALLNRLGGMPTVEKLTFDHTLLSRRDAESIAAFSNLKSLAINRGIGTTDLQAISGHRSLGRLAVDRTTPDKEWLPFLKSLPRLQEVSIGIYDDRDSSTDTFQKLLQQALPRCKCRVRDVEG